MTDTATIPTIRPTVDGRAVPDRHAASDLRLVPVPTGAGVPLADRVLMHLGLALLLASSRHASRPVREPRPARVVQTRRPTVEALRPFC